MKLSIIVPIYNVEKYLYRCVDSILAQTFTDFELILVDDGSPDGCPAICDEYALKDARIRVIHKANGGLSDARNAGLDVAQGEYIGFIDSDDYIEPRMYQQLIELLERYDADIAACSIIHEREDGVITSQWPNLTEDKLYTRHDFIDHFYPDVRRDIQPSSCNKVFKKELFRSLRYPKGKLYEDAFIQLPLYDRCDKIVVCHEAFYHYIYDRGGSIQNNNYSVRRLHLVEFNYKQYLFFKNKGNISQQRYILASYLNRYMQNHHALHLFHKDLIKSLAPYKKQFRALLPAFLSNPNICKLKKYTALLMLINSHLSYRICKKYFPECLPETLNQ